MSTPPLTVEKKPGETVVKLSKDDIEFLKRNTRYSEKEIKEWFSGFIDVCPGGQIDRQSIADIYAMPRRNADKFIDQMFKLFDMDGDGNISFREFVLATNLTTAASAEEKLKWAFKLYDKDESGFIDMEELLSIITTFYSMEGVPKDSAKEKADLIFKSLDTNGDGALDEMEFCAGCLNDPEFANMIQAGVDKLKTEQDFAQKMRKTV